ncbi:MAG: PNGase F N-terminal domain-containing protein [Treponema sp.]
MCTNKSIIFSLFLIFLIFSCKNGNGNYKVLGDSTIEVFKNAPVLYNDKVVPNGYNEPDANGIIRLANGRVILKRVELPKYERNIDLKLKVRLVSNGEGYDISGSIFIISDSKKGVSPINVAKGESYPSMSGKLNEYPGIIRTDEYEPCVEAMSFMTPFGVGHFNDIPLPQGIDKWEEDVKWECDISHLYSLLENGSYIGCWLDTWNKDGFLIDVKLEITESKEDKPMEKYKVLSLINTCPYLGQKYPDVFAHLKAGIGVDSNMQNQTITEAKLYYTTTGHGGQADGDEFNKKQNIISLNDQELKKYVPWIESCEAYRKWNPNSKNNVHGGNSSSDLARSNWCPGSMVPPIIIDLDIDALKTDDGTFKFAVPKAKESIGKNYNYWLISSYIIYK